MKLLIAFSLVFIFSCQHKNVISVETKKSDMKNQDTKAIELDKKLTTEAIQPSRPLTHVMPKSVPNFGIIFSAGGARAWAHVAVLKEMQKYKFPVVSIAGIEWGAVVGAIFAQSLSSNEVEWEMSKFKSLDKANEFIQTVFAKKTVADMKTPFACPSLNLKSQTVYLLNRGNVDQFLPFCLPSPGLLKPYGQSVALMTDIAVLVQHLKSTGVQKIILINILNAKNNKPYVNSIESLENQLWVASATQLAKKNIGLDEVIEISIPDFGIEDFDHRREIMAKGSETSYNQIKKLAEKYGL